MTAKELFGVGVRLVGIVAALVYLPALLQRDFLGAVPGAAGLDRPVMLPGDNPNDDWRAKIPKDFRDG